MDKSMDTLEGRLRVKSVSLQVPIEEEVNLERQMADVDHVVGQSIRFFKEQVQVGESKTTVQGSIGYRILYAAAGGGAKLCSISGSIPFAQSIVLEKEPDWEVEVHVEIGASTVKRLNSRKLSVFAMVNLYGEAYSAQRQSYIKDITGAVEKRFATMPYSRMIGHGTTAVSIKEAMSLPENEPDISRILYENVELRGVELIPGEGQLTMRGEVAVFMVYEGEEPEGSVRYYADTLVVEEHCEYPGIGEASMPTMRYEIVSAQVKEAPNEDGQMRHLHVSIEMEIAYTGYENEELRYLADAYAKQERIILKNTECLMEKSRSCQLMRVSVDETFAPSGEERLLMIYPVGAKVQMEKPELLEGELMVEGTVVCTLLYVGMSGIQPAVTELTIPFHKTIHREEKATDEKAHWEANVWGDVASFHVAILNGTQAEVRVTVNLTAVTQQVASCHLITDIQSEPYEEPCGPGMVGAVLSSSEELWELAKENRTTVDTILRINELSEADVKPGIPVLVCQNL
ncbi:MAG: DUF3794 domain-containing protein [Lachnospiraceae bacterium]|nr:DUF3794 domain-containing protein [Lachnospiraceae bacterium]